MRILFALNLLSVTISFRIVAIDLIDDVTFFPPFIDINSMPRYIVILHALPNLSFSFTITFNNNRTIVEIHYNVNNNILTSKT